MTTLTSTSPLGETAWKKELELSGELFQRLIDALLNRIFDLRPAKAARRLRYLIVLFFVAVFIVSLRFYPLDLWAKFIRDIFLYYLNPSYPAIYIGEPISNLVNFVFHVFTDPRILQYFPVFVAPFFIALQTASLYLRDIFELEHVSVARGFVWSVALLGSEETIRISQGEISEDSRERPTFLIGGPGKVIVELDSVALFEKPDGSPRIIGPTGTEPSGKATLDGFERFRQAIDLRDHFVELRDIDGKASAVKSRSLDGIPVTATDVQFVFSVHRKRQKPTLEFPYPFDPKAIEQLIYKATSKVTPTQKNPSTFEFSWINNMVSLIRGRLGGFMSDHNLTEYLASIGKPEFERAKQYEERISAQEQKLSPSDPEDLPQGRKVNPPPEFTPRHKVSDLFAQFVEEYSKSTYDRGVELRWIGVGTWMLPTEIIPETKVVPEKHLEAWKISRENIFRGSKKSIDELINESSLTRIITLIQDVPVEAYQKAREEQTEYKNSLRALLLSYRQQLIEAKNLLLTKKQRVPNEIEDGIKNINRVFGNWVGGD